MGGVVGQFFKPIGITVSADMLTSLLEARTLSPVQAIYSLNPSKSNSPRQENKLGAIQPNLLQLARLVIKPLLASCGFSRDPPNS
jgi:multidrug efflux pump subunit AcrB